MALARTVVLICIAIVFGLIFSMTLWPDKWRKFFAWLKARDKAKLEVKNNKKE